MSDLLQRLVDDIHAQLLPNTDGKVADYIPALLNVNADAFGIAVATVGGEVVTAGDPDDEFTIQSVSKPFAFATALESVGRENVFAKVDVEPSGDPFNSIVLRPDGRPANPMVNAGAIAVVGQLERPFEQVHSIMSRCAGEELEVDEDVHRSEMDTAHRNRAIAHLLRSHDMIGDPVEGIVDAYTRQCAVKVSARKLAIMAATIANIGRCPVTGDSVLSAQTVRDVMSVMASAGMYDSAGNWALNVGVPAKSGVSGGVIAIVNRQLGIGLYSPRLDEHGNSVRAIAACIRLAEELGLHGYEFSNVGSMLVDVYLT